MTPMEQSLQPGRLCLMTETA